MVFYFSYEGNRTQVLKEIKDLLIAKGFVLNEYAPTEGFLFTDYKLYDWGTGDRLIAIVVNIDDKITVTGMGKLAIPTANIGEPNSILKIKNVDRLPYKIQKKIFFPLIDSIDSLGYKII